MKSWLPMLAVAMALCALPGNTSAHRDGSTFHWGGGSPFHWNSAAPAMRGGGGRDRHSHQQRFRGGGAVVIGVAPLWLDYPYPTVDQGAALDSDTPVYVEKAAPDDIAKEPNAKYYCPDFGYYPSVQSCPNGWLRVVPGGAGPN